MKDYDIMGLSAHTHTATISDADFSTLAGGGGVDLESSEILGHTHAIDVSCE